MFFKSIQFSLTIFFLACLKVVLSKQDRCLGLVLKGGANRGSYEAGALFSLVTNLPPEDVQYDVVSGISVGSLNAAHCASYPKGQELDMALELLDLWTQLTAGHLYESWGWGGIISGLLFQKGLYNTQPLHEFIQEYFKNRTFHRQVHINSVDANTGNVVTFDETMPMEVFMKGLMGSTAVPFLFPPVEFEDKLLTDGGVAWNLDITSAIEKCRTLVDRDDQIYLDVVDVDKVFMERPKQNKTGGVISNLLRYREIRNYYYRMNDHIEVQYAFPNVNFRHVIMPKEALDPMYKELSMDQKLLEKMINQGMHDALEVIRSRTVSIE